MKAIAIRALRTRLGLTQAELAAKLGVTQSAVSKFENRKTLPKPIAILLQQLAETQPAGSKAG